MPNTPAKSRRASAANRQSVNRNLRMSALFMLVLLIGLIGGIVLGRATSTNQTNSGSGPFADLDAVADVLMDNYYYRPTNDQQRSDFEDQLQQSAISGMLAGLNDQYTRFLLPDDANIAADELEGEYGGIGVEVQLVDGGFSISRVEPGSPASIAGISVGDVIERIDGKPAAALTNIAAGSDISGPVDSTVVLSVKKQGVAASVEVTITRQAIIVHQVTYEMVPNTSYIHISIDIFGDRTVAELDQALAAGSTNGATGIILDLRGNGGGWVKAAQATLGRFLDPSVGPALYEDTTPGSGGETAVPIESGGAKPTSLPLIVLVDGNTASAAEIVAGSLRDYNRALVVGDRTYGKGSVQRVFDLGDGSSLRVTVAEWLTPSMGRIQDEGIRPDLNIAELGAATPEGDPYVGSAVSFLDRGIATPVQLATSRSSTPEPIASPTS